MTDRVVASSGDWAVASDGVQWMLMRRRTRPAGSYWQPVSFVRSTKDILARCMREKGVGAETARLLLEALPEASSSGKRTSQPRKRPHLKSVLSRISELGQRKDAPPASSLTMPPFKIRQQSRLTYRRHRNELLNPIESMNTRRRINTHCI